jgi:hypothetical protein
VSSGLTDGIFSDQKCQFWHILEGLWMENLVYVLMAILLFFIAILVYFMAI